MTFTTKKTEEDIMQTINALLVVPKNLVRNDVGALGQFMFALQQKYGAALVIEKNAVWSSFPFLEVVSCGMVSLAVAFAKKFEIQIRHDTDLHEVGKYLDRVLNAGLILKYATATDAVEDFDQKVVKKVQQRIEEKKMGTFTALAEDVAYSFFADVYASAKKFWEKTLHPALDSIDKMLIKAYQKNGIELLGITEYRPNLRYAARVFDIRLRLPELLASDGKKIQDKTLRFETGRNEVFQVRAKIEKLLQIIDVLERIPVNYAKLIEFGFIEKNRDTNVVSDNEGGVADKWITTQVQRILAKLKDDECINDREIVMANSAKRQDVKSLTRELIVRMKNRGMRMRPTDAKILEELVSNTYPKGKVGNLESSDRLIRGNEVFYVTQYDRKFLDEASTERFLEYYRGNMSKKDRQLIFQHIAENHPKILLKTKGAGFCLQNNLLSKEQIVQMLIKHPVKVEVGTWAVEVLKDCEDLGEYWKYKQLFVKKRIQDLSPKAALDNIAHLSTEFVDNFIATKAVLLNSENDEYWGKYDKFGLLVQKMSKSKLRELMDSNPIDGDSFGFLVAMQLESFDGLRASSERSEQIKEDLRRMIEVIADPWWIVEQAVRWGFNDRFDVIFEILKGEYKDTDIEKKHHNAPWGNGPEKTVVQSIVRHFPELNVGSMQEIVQRFPELEMLEKCKKKKYHAGYKKYRNL